MGRPKLVPKPVPKSRTASGPFLKPKPIWQKAKSKELLPEKTAGGSTFFGKPNLIHRDEAWWLGGSCQTRLRNNCRWTVTCLQKTHQFLVPEIERETTPIKHTLKALAQAPKRRPFGGVVNKAQPQPTTAKGLFRTRPRPGFAVVGQH